MDALCDGKLPALSKTKTDVCGIDTYLSSFQRNLIARFLNILDIVKTYEDLNEPALNIINGYEASFFSRIMFANSGNEIQYYQNRYDMCKDGSILEWRVALRGLIQARLHAATDRKKGHVDYRAIKNPKSLMEQIEQLLYYSNLIQKHPGWVYAGVFADEGITGTRANRPEFQRMLAECEAGSIDIVLTKSISRFARNTVDLLETVRRLRELGIEIQFEKEGISTLSDEGELMLTLLASFAQEESYSISENCKWGIRKRYENGRPRNFMLFGYRVVDGCLTIKEDEAETVRRIFQMFLAGDSCYAIARQLNREGVRPYRGTAFHCEVILTMIRQEKYAGCTLCQKYYSESHITHKEMKNRGELPMYFAEGTHPAIISMETFQAAQEEFAWRYGVEIRNGIAEKASYLKHDGSNGRHDPPHRRPQWSDEQRRRHSEFFRNRENAENAYPFSRFIQCEGCGSHLRGQKRYYVDGTTEVFWICDMHSKCGPNTQRPLPLRDGALKEQIAREMGMPAFDEEAMHSRLGAISVDGSIITLHYRDGSLGTFKYIQPRQKKRKRNDGNS